MLIYFQKDNCEICKCYVNFITGPDKKGNKSIVRCECVCILHNTNTISSSRCNKEESSYKPRRHGQEAFHSQQKYSDIYTQQIYSVLCRPKCADCQSFQNILPHFDHRFIIQLHTILVSCSEATEKLKIFVIKLKIFYTDQQPT